MWLVHNSDRGSVFREMGHELVIWRCRASGQFSLRAGYKYLRSVDTLTSASGQSDDVT